MITMPHLKSGKNVKLLFVAVLALTILTTLLLTTDPRCALTSQTADTIITPTGSFDNYRLSMNRNGNWRHLSPTQTASLSRLGRVLYLDEDPPAARNRTFLILVWKYGYTTHDRHMKQYSDKEVDPFARCAVKNCVVTYEDAAAARADMVILHLHRTENVEDMPPVRRPEQIWAFSTDESPTHTFLNGQHNFNAYNGLFNWSMHYRMDSDIPVPYGRTVAKRRIDNDRSFDFSAWLTNRSNTSPIAVMGSNCGSQNHRWEYVAELRKWIDVDFYGGCGTLECPGHFTKDCPKLAAYRFYLAFENSNCDEYITEKLWWNAYAKDAIPIVMGGAPSRRNYAQLLPPHSYINVDDFASPRDLAFYLHYLLDAPDRLAEYFQWRRYFEVRNEHGYFQTPSYHYCRACEALNYNDLTTKKTYTDLLGHWSEQTHCAAGWDMVQGD
ncbi:4-galactosyl-N-acetylglucosaminide 3-alpha-L-fucosyltransferase FUT5-like isoform X2 [Atheta coriaria]|uniref:4-galactosyl-N-acetylglucosaminide 3-alpha-L-fucosyltransferase FUT5-like isoform X2 n=1 Tax=Dalotia coriaria TaxID=877792 RepID=UPI0031F38E22